MRNYKVQQFSFKNTFSTSYIVASTEFGNTNVWLDVWFKEVKILIFVFNLNYDKTLLFK